MRHIKVAIFIVIFAAYGIICQAATIDTRSGIFDTAFRTLRINRTDMPLTTPIIRLDSEDKVSISFDELAEVRSYLRYSLVHCNADWQPSSLVETEYLDGFNIADVEDFAMSRATAAHYVNYNITIPNEHIRPTVSGNYLLKVYHEDTPDITILQIRFMVIEQLTSIYADVTSRTDIDYNKDHQQISLVIDTDRADVKDPFNDIYVVITQNGREDNKIVMQQPLRIVGNKAYYEHQKPLIFPAGNEYRRMEIISTHNQGMHVAEIGYAEPYYHMELETDYPRNESLYLYDQTQHGRFLIREYNSTESDTEADYIVTHFALKMPEIVGADVFLDGDFSLRRFTPESRMIYDKADGIYKSVQLLKQGAYNYQYLVVPRGSDVGYTSIIEGDFYQTVNEYSIFVYHHQPLARYDRLIGYATLTSGR